MDIPRNVVVFFDKNCIDGTASVSIFRDVLKKFPLVTSTYVPIDYNDPLNRNAFIFKHLRDGDEVFFLDTTPQDDTLRCFVEPPEDFARVKRVTVFDHHKTEVDRLLKFQKKRRAIPFRASGPEFEFVLDANMPAAAMLVWDYYHFESYDMPPLLKWIGRMDVEVDLKTKREKAVAAFIDCNELDTPEKCFAAFDRLNKEITHHEGTVAKRGKEILKEQAKTIENNIKTAFLYTKVEIMPDRVEWIPIVNTNPRNHGRMVHEALLEKAQEGSCGIAGAWFVDSQGRVQMPLRSNGRPDVAAIAVYVGSKIGIGGGGHPSAAVVTFEGLSQFSRNVPLYTKEQMFEERLSCAVSGAEIPCMPAMAITSLPLMRKGFH